MTLLFVFLISGSLGAGVWYFIDARVKEDSASSKPSDHSKPTNALPIEPVKPKEYKTEIHHEGPGDGFYNTADGTLIVHKDDPRTQKRLDEIEKTSKIPPIDERLRKFLDDSYKAILPMLEKNEGPTKQFVIRLEVTRAGEFKKLCGEPEADKYIQILPAAGDDAAIAFTDKGAMTDVRFLISKSILKQ